MGILYKPPCKDDANFAFPSNFHILLKVNGCWPTEGDAAKSFRFRFLVWMYTCLFCFATGCLTFTVVTEFTYFFVNIADVTKAVDGMCTTMMGVVVVIRMLHTRYEINNCKDCLRYFCDKIWIKEESHPVIFRRCIERTKPRFYLSLALWGTLAIYIVMPIVVLLTTDQTMESTDKGLPYSMIFPYDEQKFWNYIFTFIVSTYSGFITVSLYYALDGILVLLISFLSGQFEILHGSIMRLVPECHAEWLTRYGENVTLNEINYRSLQDMYNKRLHDVYSHHNDLIGFFMKLNEYISFPLTANFVCSTFQISFLGFQFLTGGTNSFSDFLRILLFFCSATGQLYMMCDLGTVLITRSADTAHYLFMCNWEGGRISQNSPLRLQHDDMEAETLSVKLPLWQYITYYPTNKDFQHKLRFMIMRSHHPLQLAAMKFISLSLESFSRILSSSMSYFTLLKTILDKQN